MDQLLAALLGALAGVGIMGTADHFTHDRGLLPIPICPHCGTPSAGQAYIPVLGPLLLRGRCERCTDRGPWLLAAVVQAIAAVLAVLLYHRYGVSALLFSSGIETIVLTAVAVVDFQHRLIPTLLVYPTIVFALICSAFWPNLGPLNSLLGGGIAFGLFFALAFVARLTFGDGALGDGDVTLAALIGVICGYPLVLLSLSLGALCGGIGAVLALLVRRSAFGSAIPYGPFLVMGAVYVLIAGNTTQPLYDMMHASGL